MRRKKNRRVSAGRFVAGMAAIAGWSAAMLFGGREGGTALAVVAGVLFTVPLCSLGEWLVHGVLYHGHVPGFGFIRKIHHQGHHFAIFPPTRYVQDGPYEFMRFRKPLLPFRMSDNWLDNALTMYSQVGLHFGVGIPLIVLPAWLVTGSVPFLLSSLGTLTVISWMLGYVHGVIHTPRNRLVERTRWFQWLNHHHYIHHVDLQANINFGLPLCDFLFGTQKWELTSREAAAFPPFDEARRLPAKDDQAGTSPESGRAAA